jgi:hypothetical protein
MRLALDRLEAVSCGGGWESLANNGTGVEAMGTA